VSAAVTECDVACRGAQSANGVEDRVQAFDLALQNLGGYRRGERGCGIDLQILTVYGVTHGDLQISVRCLAINSPFTGYQIVIRCCRQHPEYRGAHGEQEAHAMSAAVLDPCLQPLHEFVEIDLAACFAGNFPVVVQEIDEGAL